MNESDEKLEESLQLYEAQLCQINEAIVNNDGAHLDELHSLRSNLTELIALTKESVLESTKCQVIDDNDSFAREYELFKAELRGESRTEDTDPQNGDNIEKELDNLVGTKCQAPFVEQWAPDSVATYHNALIMSIDLEEAVNKIRVKVVFVNPTCREMIPCRYYLDGICKFADDQCVFSHGYVVNFSDLKEYKEPNFNLLRENVSVLAKDEDDLWKRATLTALLPESNQCTVKFELGRKAETIIDVQHTLPLNMEDDGNDEAIPTCWETDLLDGVEGDRKATTESMVEEQSQTTKLGEWEKYTTGIGSKLMANMGYIAGTGLGKHKNGRVEPVDAVMLPPGKSLDHCMALREKARGNPNLFKVHKLEKKIRHKRKVEDCTTNVTPKKSKDVFAFINDSLSIGTRNKACTESKKIQTSILKTSTSKALNVNELKINERINKKNYELMVLKEKLSRQKQNTVGYNAIFKQIRQVQEQLCDMQTSLKDLYKEKNYRKTMKELTEF